MTDADWKECENAEGMRQWLGRQRDSRKIRLFAAACCRRVWHLLSDERSRQAVEAAEDFADGHMTLQELERANRLAREATKDEHGFDPSIYVSEAYPYTVLAFQRTAEAAAFYQARSLDETPGSSAWGKAREEEATAQMLLLRELFGPEKRVDGSNLRWTTGIVASLAQGIYADRAFERLPILADALEESDCTDPSILGHCRGPEPHYRGCWVVDLVLGRE